MSRNPKRKNKCRKPDHCNPHFQLLGLLLLAFGAITICAFLLPIKAWIFLLGCLLLVCGVLLVCGC